MVNPASFPVNFGSRGNIGTIDVSKFSRSGSPYTNPDLFKLMLAQMIGGSASDFDTLFGDNEASDTSLFGGTSFFGQTPSSTSPLFNGINGVSFPSDIGGQNIFNSGVSPAIELIARSNLIGKTVSAVDPATQQTISGKVSGVSVEGGIVLINVGGTKVPPENLVSVVE